LDKAHMIQFNSAKAAEPESVRQSIGHMVEDIIILGELQARLFQSDAREITGQIMRPLVILAGGISLFLATVPVGLLAIAHCLVAAGVPLAAAYGLVAVASLVVAAGMGAWAWRRFRRLPPAFARSRDELRQNVSWITAAVKGLAAKPEQARGEGLYTDFLDQVPANE
jgi:hypothetical protein